MDLRTRIIITSSDQTGPGVNSVKTGLAGVEQKINQAKNALLGFLGVQIGGQLVKDLISTADQYKSIASLIRQAAGENANYESVQKRVLAIANASNTALGDTARLYARSSEALKNTGINQEKVLKFTEAVSLSFKANSSSAAEVSSTVTQLTQGIATSAVQWADFGQLADTNLRLVNIAAKNLGHDGIGELKEAISSGKVSNVELVEAIVGGFDQIKRAADTAGSTVSGSIQRLSNNFTVFIGESVKASGATAKLSGLITLLADNLKPLANIALIIAEIYAAKLVGGLLQSAEAWLENKAAAEAQAEAVATATEAARESLVTAAQVAAIRVRTTRALIEEAKLQVALARSEEQRAAAQAQLAQSMSAYHAAVDAANEAQANLGDGTDEAGAQVSRFAGILATLRKIVGVAFAVKISIDAVSGLLETLGEYNEQVRIFSFAWKATLEEVMATAVHFFSGDFLTTGSAGLRAKFDAIQQKYGDLAVASTDSAIKAKAAEEEKAKATEEAAIKMKASWDKVQEAMKNLTATIDDDVARQNAILQQRLDERLAAIDAGNAQELEKDALRTEALVNAARNELQIAEGAASAKLQLIGQAFQTQLEQQAKGSKQAQELDRQSIETRKSIYSELAGHYAAVVDRLGQEHQREVQSAQQAGQQIRDLATQHQFDLADIARQGVSEREKIDSEELEFSQAIAEANAEIAKGKAGDQDKINDLLGRAKQLSQDLGNATISLAQTDSEKSSARSANADRLNKLYEAQTQALENNKKAHEDNAGALAEKQQEALSKLSDVNGKISEITTQLEKTHALQITADTAAIDTAIEKINSIPTEKTVVIKTVNQGEAAQTAQRLGGPIQAFATGGWPRLQGRLPGYGGGDKIRALLEKGEWIIRKEAVRKIEATFGAGSMAAVNQGRLPIPALQPVIQRASGGPVFAEASEREKKILDKILANLALYSFNITGAGSGINTFNPRLAMRRIEPVLRQEGLLRFKAQLDQLIPNLIGKSRDNLTGSGIGLSDRDRKINIDKEATAERLKQQLFSGKSPDSAGSLSDAGRIRSNLRVAVPKLPPIQVPAPSLPIPAGPASSSLAQAAQGRADKVVRVEFQAPGGQPVAGQFNEKDMDKLFKALKDAGLRTSGGHF